MFTLKDVYIDALWIFGLAGVFATFSYIDYYRHHQGWRWRDAWQRPCLLMPLSLSLSLFSLGLTLNGATAYQPDPWWQTAIWAVMTVLFVWQTWMYWQVGRRHGWDVAIDAAQPAPPNALPQEEGRAQQSE